MPLELIDKIKPKNGGKFPLVDAEDVLMPDGKRLDEFRSVYPVEEGAADLQPETYYAFGTVDSLAVNLVDPGDGLAHEFTFEFVPSDNFSGLTVTPEVKWVAEPQYPAGKTVQVSILRGIGVMACA